MGEHHTHLQTRRNEQQTHAFKQRMKHRNVIEGTQSEVVRGHGMRHARFRGLVNILLFTCPLVFRTVPRVGESCESLQVQVRFLLRRRMTLQAELLQQRSSQSSIFIRHSSKRIGHRLRRTCAC